MRSIRERICASAYMLAMCKYVRVAGNVLNSGDQELGRLPSGGARERSSNCLTSVVGESPGPGAKACRSAVTTGCPLAEMWMSDQPRRGRRVKKIRTSYVTSCRPTAALPWLTASVAV